MDFGFSPSILDTPSLITPNIDSTPLIFKSSYATTATTRNVNNDDNNNDYQNPLSITTNEKSLSISSADMKLSKIEHDLKESFSQPRKPTESLFQKMVQAGVLTLEKNISIPPTTDDDIPVDIPSTAEVMNVLESFAKNLSKDNIERDTTTIGASEIHRLDTSPTHSMGVIVSPKKKLLIRSQSHTEPTSPPLNQFSQTQNEEMATEEQHFQRLQDLPIVSHSIDSNTQLENHNKPAYQTQVKQQPMMLNHKRTFQQTIVGPSIPKTNAIVIPPHEVTSTGQFLGIKRPKMTPMPTNNINSRSSTNDEHSGNDDQRKKQIRDSNREAARRCRERRRQYIEQLEGNLEQCKSQIKLLNEKFSRAERENTQLHAVLTETKIFHSSSRLSSNEGLVDFANVISTTNGMDLHSETTDGNTIQRNFLNRNTR